MFKGKADQELLAQVSRQLRLEQEVRRYPLERCPATVIAKEGSVPPPTREPSLRDLNAREVVSDAEDDAPKIVAGTRVCAL